MKVIPRLVDSTGATPLSRNVGNKEGGGGGLDPATWDADDVSSFLGINECATLVDSFKEQASTSLCMWLGLHRQHFDPQSDHDGLALDFFDF